MKHLPSIITAFVCTAFAGIIIAHAQGYTPLAPLPGTVDTVTGKTDLSLYLSGGVKLLIALGAGLAILFAIIGGTQYVAASINPSAKKDALERIWNALIGLAIILTSYLLLNSINPKLVGGGFLLAPVTGVAPTAPVVVTTPTWFDDSVERQQLLALGVFINHDNCINIGQGKSVANGGTGGAPCTSVYQLNMTAISALGLLKSSCSSNGCLVVVSGGTEYWLHSNGTQHRPGNSVVDIATNIVLDAKIQAGSSMGIQTSCSSLGPAWKLPAGANVGTYVYEPNYDPQGNVAGHHWHVCYY